MKYPFEEVELKWQKFWEENKVFKTDLTQLDKKHYCLVMFIYPSAAKMHIGHWYNYGPTDSYARFKKLNGFNVFEPIGYDAFGLPAENYAIKTGVHPKDSTLQNIEDIRIMVKRMGGMYDWSSELMTCVPEYYKWNQWLFLQLYKKGLAYRKNAPVNWCPSCQTVLAREQVLNDGSCERCGTTVIQKNLTQWFFKITDYAEELLQGLEKIDWPEKTKAMQYNWIGKSIGAEVNFKVDGSNDIIKIFTTRPDTLFGATYMVLAPEHPLVEKLTTKEYKDKVEAYKDSIKSMTEIDRTSTLKEKTGVFTGVFAINPVNDKKIPIWIADYVLMTYGTGAIMAVPGQDERDWEFAEKYNLPIIRTVQPPDNFEGNAFVEDGPAINSSFLDGLYVDAAKEKIIKWLEEKGIGKSTINYRLRDWLISRQRYWGTPIPIIHCEKCGEVPVPEDQLPVELPYNVNFKPDGGSPLASKEEFVNVKCPKCKSDAKRDVDTMDTFVDSSWYHLRYLNPKFEQGMFNHKLANDWMPVDTYIGGSEHAVMHLLYARFINKFLRDIGLVKCDEPYQKLIHQGTITNLGAKMSKSKDNVVDPNQFVHAYGADVFRMYLMFMGPYELGGDWSDKGIVGVDRFVNRVYSIYQSEKNIYNLYPPVEFENLNVLNEDEYKLNSLINMTIHKIENAIENFSFNTSIAYLMEFINEYLRAQNNLRKELKSYILLRFIYLIAPLAPHLAEECNLLLGRQEFIYQNPAWPKVNFFAFMKKTVLIVIQINGKVRDKIEIPTDFNEEQVRRSVLSSEKVKSYVEEKQIVKEIYVPNKIYNIVVK